MKNESINHLPVDDFVRKGIGRINTPFSFFHQVEKEIHDAVQP
jgi:hypothetical protein